MIIMIFPERSRLTIMTIMVSFPIFFEIANGLLT